MIVIVCTDSFAQPENSTSWKNYTNNYFNLTLEIPTNWKVTDDTTRFSEDKSLHFDHSTYSIDQFDNKVLASTGLQPIDTTNAKTYLEDEKKYTLSNDEADRSTIKIIEDVQVNKYNISSVPSYSFLYFENSEIQDYAVEIITFMHNGQGYRLFTIVTPPNYFDDNQYSEDLRRMINSIKLSDSNIPLEGYSISSKYGEFGSAHEHGALLIKLNDTTLNLAQQPYMIRSDYIYIGAYAGKLDGTTLHKYSTKVPMSEFFKSIKMDIANSCFITDINERYCDNDDYKLRFYVNGNETKDILKYVMQDNDRILITYGKHNSTEISNELKELNELPINKD